MLIFYEFIKIIENKFFESKFFVLLQCEIAQKSFFETV